MTPLRPRLGLALAAAALLAAPSVAQAAGKIHTVEIRNLAFAPATVDAQAGDVIVWVNADIFRHSATARDKSFDLDLAPGAKGRTVVSRAGAIDVYCRYHPDMKAKIVVRAKPRR